MSDESWNFKAAPHVDQLSPRDFQKIAGLVTCHSGIKLPSNKHSMLEGRVRKRARSAGFRSIHDYCAHLFAGGGVATELPHLIDVATTNKTDFFREPQHFQLMETRMLPELLLRRRGQNRGNPAIKVWSAACSNGAEAYTIAMVLADAALARRDFDWSILGTDISRRILIEARQAIYLADMVQPVPAPKQSRYIMTGRCETPMPRVRIVPELRQRARFAPLNLMDVAYPFDTDFDIIFLRNVLIYFEKQDQKAVVTRLCRHLRPGGYLLLGHAESMIGMELGLRQIAPATFQVP